MLVGSIAVSLLVGALGYRLATTADAWWESLHRPSLTPSLRLMGALWLAVHALFGVGVGIVLADSADGLVLTMAILSVVSGLGWVAVLFRRRSVRNGFFLVSVAWVPTVLTAMAVVVREPVAGALSASLSLVLTVAAAWSFVLWQINEPTRYH